MKKEKCLFWKKGNKCNSDYTKEMKCNGIKKPDKCPYKFGGNFAMAVRDNCNWRKK
jgi:hypothetical protein